MKSFLYLVLWSFICTPLALTAQTVTTTREVVQVIEPRNIYLNGGLRSEFGGKSRTSIKVDLPENTIQWFYSFSTSPGKSGTKNLNLLAQVTAIALQPNLAFAAKQIKIPEGSASIDAKICDQENIDLFIRKVDNNGGTYYYMREGSVENTRSASVAIDEFTEGTWYIGLKNPSTANGINITIEVVAIVEKLVETSLSPQEKKAELYGNLGWKAFENEDYEKAIAYYDQSIALYPYGWVYANKALAQFVSGLETEGVANYIEAIPLIHKGYEPDYVFAELIKDIENVLLERPDLESLKEIKALLEIELANYKEED